MPGLPTLVAEVFVQRMGGAQQTTERLNALGGWLFALHPSDPMRAANDPAVMRGHELFNASEVGCNGCHSGAKLTNNQTVDVGTGEPLQVPSLVGIAYRAPFLHNGCAPTLRDRFDDTACAGGDRHGNTSQLSTGQVDDLVAYLESL
jgi:cytochrome c peroxidase